MRTAHVRTFFTRGSIALASSAEIASNGIPFAFPTPDKFIETGMIGLILCHKQASRIY